MKIQPAAELDIWGNIGFLAIGAHPMTKRTPCFTSLDFSVIISFSLLTFYYHSTLTTDPTIFYLAVTIV